jgi:hypothetical protein
MRNPREGWGLTNDGTNLIFSDGGPSLYYADPKTFAVRKSVKIRMDRPGNVLGPGTTATKRPSAASLVLILKPS